jgi:hypothetical protein
MCSWRRVAVARVFALVVRCRIMLLLLYSRVGKNRDTRRECPAGAGPGRSAQWFLPGGFSRKAGPIKHQLVLVCRSGGSARKNQSRCGAPIAHTDLLGVRRFGYYIFCFHVNDNYQLKVSLSHYCHFV